MPLAAVLLVLLSIATLLLYVLPAARTRLGDYVQDRTYARAASAATAVEEAGTGQGDLGSELDLAAEAGDGQVLVVNREGRVVARAGRPLLPARPEGLLQRAATGDRFNGRVGERRVAVVPVVREGNLEGGVVFAAGEAENAVYNLFLRSGIEAAAVASVLGGGLALLLATLLSRRVERLTLGARALERGDLSDRLSPGYNDELGELARAFNGMAEKLQGTFSRLKESGATLNAILNNLSEGVLATDLKGKVMFVNLAARDMLGLGSEGPLDRPPDPWTDFSLPGAVAHCARERECGEARVQEGGHFYGVRLERLDQFDDHRGGVLVVIRDLSEGRRLDERQQRFLANAAHELKTPITTIVGSAELLLTGSSEEDPEVRRRFLEHILAEARRMQRLSETLLRLARTGTDLRDPEIEAVDLDGVGRDAAERVRPLAESAGLRLRVEGEGGRVRADRGWLEQALLVLLGNAVQHAEGGGEVRVRVGENTVTVEDDGPGIGEADRPYVFDRFYRGKKAGGARRKDGGFGLGLAICKDLVERMGGEIALRSEEGAGATFEIRLPEVD